ncbi:MAG: T9SS type A sorting domain-containing protein, partial [Bacteroidota bacterium]
MLLGWSKPILISTTEIDTSLEVWASQLPQTPDNKVFLLYDSVRGTNEFYLIEQRFKQAIPDSDTHFVPIHSWWSPGREDNFSTTASAWAGYKDDAKAPDYQYDRMEGFAFHPSDPLPADVSPDDVVPLYAWWSPSRGDNFMTTDPAWAGMAGDTKDPDYTFVRIEGFVYKSDVSPEDRPGTIPLYSWWNAARADNFITSNPAWAGAPGDTVEGYTFNRLEGYVSAAPFHNYDTDAWNTDANGLPDEGIGLWHVFRDPLSRRLRKIPSIATPTVGAGKLPLNAWYSPLRQEHITTTQENWQWYTALANSNGYRLSSIDGYLTPPDAQPGPTEVPLYSWYSAIREDNFTTTDPNWSGNVGDQQSGYELYRIEGYVESVAKPGYDTLFSWWSPTRGDNYLTTRWSGNADGSTGKQIGGYTNFRIEGFIERSDRSNDEGLLIESPVGEAGLSPTNSLWACSDARAELTWFDGSPAFSLDVSTPLANQPVIEVIINPTGSPTNCPITSITDELDAGNKADIQLTLYPNPIISGQSVTLEYILPKSGPHVIRLFNLQGQTLYEMRKPDTLPGTLQSATLASEQELPPGMYLIQLTQNDKKSATRLVVR